MAGEVAHVVYGARVLAFLGEKVKTPLFWVGTLFPDIKNLGAALKKHTHPDGVTLGSLAGENDFETGARVHAWIDHTRELFLSNQRMKERLRWHPFVPHSLKLLEDEILYDRFDDWEIIFRALNRVRDEELKIVSSRDQVRRWHDILQEYLAEKPSDESRYKLSLAIGLSENSAQEVNSVVASLRTDGEAVKLIDEFVRHLEILLQ